MGSDFDPVDLRVNATKFSYQDLCNFTDGFCKDNFLWFFLWGDVFRGKAYLNGMQPQEVTVKIWDDSDQRMMVYFREMSIERFREELLFFTDHHVKFHPNLPRLLGYCYEGNKFGVVYDLKPGVILHKAIPQDNFGWLFRMKVAFEMARLLEFMHSSTDYLLPYLVRNLDAKHIMLDQDCNSYLFDLSMISGRILTDKRMIEDIVYGCAGYVDKYFAIKGIGWTEMTDVYAYGCLLLALIRKTVFDVEKDAYNSAVPLPDRWAKREYEKSKDMVGSDFSLVHRSLVEEPVFHLGDGPKITDLVLKCIEYYPSDRPTMEEVINSLLDLEVVKCHAETFSGFKRMTRIPYPRKRHYPERQKNSSTTIEKGK